MSSIDVGDTCCEHSQSPRRKVTYVPKTEIEHQVNMVTEAHDEFDQRTFDEISQKSERVYAPDIKFK